MRIENAGVRMPASRTDPAHPWVRWTVESMERTLGRRVQVIPNSSGGLPGDVFVDHLGVALIWVPHSYNGCKQHGPDEHFLIAPAREGIAAFAGIWWDLGEPGTPYDAPVIVGPRTVPFAAVSLEDQRKPTWLVEVSTGCAGRCRPMRRHSGAHKRDPFSTFVEHGFGWAGS